MTRGVSMSYECGQPLLIRAQTAAVVSCQRALHASCMSSAELIFEQEESSPESLVFIPSSVS